MNLEQNAATTLSKLDLTALEAKVYLSLCKYEELTAAEISTLTKKARPDIYRVIKRLQGKNLVEKILGNPIRIKAVPIKTGLQLLLENKKEEYEKVKKETNKLFHSLNQTKLNNEEKPIEEKFILIPKKEAVIAKIRQAIDNAQESVDLVITNKRFVYGINNFGKSLSKAWDRGVMFRCILKKPEKESIIEDPLQVCRNNEMVQLRFFNGQPKSVLGVYDKKSVFIVLNPNEDVPSSPALWSNSKSLLAIAQDYFNVLWICSNNEKLSSYLHPHLKANF